MVVICRCCRRSAKDTVICRKWDTYADDGINHRGGRTGGGGATRREGTEKGKGEGEGQGGGRQPHFFLPKVLQRNTRFKSPLGQAIITALISKPLVSPFKRDLMLSRHKRGNISSFGLYFCLESANARKAGKVGRIRLLEFLKFPCV